MPRNFERKVHFDFEWWILMYGMTRALGVSQIYKNVYDAASLPERRAAVRARDVLSDMVNR
jgi:hypothetical protein